MKIFNKREFVEFVRGNEYLYIDNDRDDSFEMRRASENPLIEDPANKKDYSLSNRCVGFNVDIGPQNQSMFYGFMVDQKNSSSTVESLEVINQMANQAGNRGGSSQSLSLYNLYKNRSYTVTLLEDFGSGYIQYDIFNDNGMEIEGELELEIINHLENNID